MRGLEITGRVCVDSADTNPFLFQEIQLSIPDIGYDIRGIVEEALKPEFFYSNI
jgi:hypothetical protein